MRLFLLLAGVYLVLYRVRRWLYAVVLQIPPPRHRVDVQRGLRIPTEDGIMLVTDHYQPADPGSYPTILIRSPYGRNQDASPFGMMLAFWAWRFAERGYHVIVQDVRGRFDSDGEFRPVYHERVDGVATLDWICQQPWYNGRVGTWGNSYLGIVQWMMAAHAPQLNAVMPSLTASNMYKVVFPDGAVDLGLSLRWPAIFEILDRRRGQPIWLSLLLMYEVDRQVQPAFNSLPVRELDQIVLRDDLPFYREWLDHYGPDDAMWQHLRDETQIEKIQVPVHMIAGWYDFFLRGQLDDYHSLRQNKQQPYLTIGPWHHFSTMFNMMELQLGLSWFEAQLKDNHAALRPDPVRVFVMGADVWRDYADWPPPAEETFYYLQAEGELSHEEPAVYSPPDTYVYDPANPTPALAGSQFSLEAGRRDNRPLEARDDVLTYTTAPLHDPVEITGPVRVVLYVGSSRPYTDFFARLCDVYPSGQSINLCDGLYRVEPGQGVLQPDGSLRLEFDLWATANRFLKGHCIRLQVSSGAHPRWSRNLGTGESISDSTAMVTAEQTIYHDLQHPSAVILPVVALHSEQTSTSLT